jgi:hypothetical protein
VTFRDFVPQVLPASMRSLAGGVPPAPPGTLFALAADGGFAVPPRKFTLHFGRERDDVHVAVGVNDPHVSRLLSPVERLVLTVLAQRYLRQERYPQPVSWKQVADDLTRVAGGREWTPKIAAHIVGAVRERLAEGGNPIRGIRREHGVGEPVGNTLNHNLIQALLKNTTLMPADLHLLGDNDGERSDG